jgi:type IV secretory pathway VirB4 component
LVDAERRAQFEEEGAHFESRYFLTLFFLPPREDAARAEAWLYENRSGDAADWRGGHCHVLQEKAVSTLGRFANRLNLLSPT